MKNMNKSVGKFLSRLASCLYTNQKVHL
uniref:Accessory gene regulator protein D n=1 Tax=Listeria monocytogenes TaxID=1639 RepID=A8E0F8_LISMN|nr:accessory gene regulator protein D [Listeria monocytogenes]